MAGLIKRGNTYYATWYEDGKERRRSLKTSDKHEALRIVAALTSNITDEREGRQPTVRECKPSLFWDAYLPWAETHHARNTVSSEWWAWKHLLKELTPQSMGHVRPRDIEAVKARWVQAGKKPTSINLWLKQCKMFYQWAADQGLRTESNPFEGIRKLRVVKPAPVFLDDQQRAAVLEAAREHSPDMHLFFALGIYAGLRRGEIVEARWKWIDTTRKTITVRVEGDWVPKGGKTRAIPLHSELQTVLEPYRQDSGHILAPRAVQGRSRYRYHPMVSFQAVVEVAGVPWCTPHTLRHTFASHAVINGVSLYKVQHWLGHSSPTTTQIYAHLLAADEDIERI